MDTDEDGIPDHLDESSNTQQGAPVKPNGCVEGDYNNDGYIDGTDIVDFADNFGQ